MKTKRYIAHFLLVLTYLFSYSYAYGWDNAGHALSAAIAWDKMTPETREAVFKIIMSAPEDSDLSVPFNFYNSMSLHSKQRDLFMYAANWADNIKDRSFKNRYRKYNHSTWHYSDIFWKDEEGRAVVLENFDGEGGEAVTKLYEFEATMRDPKAEDSAKAIALAWFVHVAGDLHNPLHNASRITTTEPKGDQGGNLFILRENVPNGQRGVNLHSFWDGLITNNDKRKNDQCDSDYITAIAKRLEKKYPEQKMGDLETGKYKEWNQEEFKLLEAVVYTPTLQRNQMPEKKYTKTALKTAERNLALAGYRIAATLNAIFGTKSTK
ncbi:MAG: S1/P1 nuclease [Pyrinomonadaceae bacterium]